MTARDVQRAALGAGRILLGVVMSIVVPVWLVFSLVDYTRPTVPANELVTPSVDVYDETGSFERCKMSSAAVRSRVPSTSSSCRRMTWWTTTWTRRP